MQVFLTCIFFSFSLQAQFTCNKVLFNIDSSISAVSMGWASNVVYQNGKIIISNSTWDSLGPSYGYFSINELNDTGKTLKHTIFRDTNFYYAITTGKSNLIKTNDHGYAVAGVKRVFIFPFYQSWGVFCKLNQNLDTIFCKNYRNVTWNMDSIYTGFQYVVQSLHDSSFYCLGIAQPASSHDSFVVVKYDKAGNFIWDTVFKVGDFSWINGVWMSHNKLYISAQKERVQISAINDWVYKHELIIEMDTNKQILNTHYMQGNSMQGGFIFNKYNESSSIYVGASDTLNMPNPLQNNLYITKLTCQIGMLDSLYRYKWRRFIKMDTCADYAFRDEHNPYFIGRLKDGGIICGGSRTDANAYASGQPNLLGYRGGWVMKLDSLGNILWDRTFIYGPDSIARWNSHYFSGFCEADNGDIICTGSILLLPPQASWLVRLDSLGRLNATDSGFVGGTPNETLILNYTYPNATIEIGAQANEILKMYPNPTTGNVHLIYNIHTAGFINVYDMQGRKVKSITINEYQHNVDFDVSNLSSGTYVVECVTKDRRYTTKLVRE